MRSDIIVLISFLILFVSISFLVNIGKEMSRRGSIYINSDLEFDSSLDMFLTRFSLTKISRLAPAAAKI